MRLSGGIDCVREWLEQNGLDPRALGERAVEGALRRRLEAMGCDEATYRARLAVDAGERERLLDAVLVPETWFFRELPAFHVLADAAGRRRVEDGVAPFRVLSLGCATGEEPWSIAITLYEAGLSGTMFQIHALDLSAAAIEVAKAGVYGPRAFRGSEQGAWRNRYFERMDTRYCRVRDEFRCGVEFHVANLTEAQWPGAVRQYDAVFCRNVLIYLRTTIREQVVKRCCDVLSPRGLLFLGHADGISACGDGFVRHRDAGAFSWVKREPDVANAPGTAQMLRSAPRPAKRSESSRPTNIGPMPGGEIPETRVAPRGGVDPRSQVQLARPDRHASIDSARALANQGDYAASESLCLEYLSDHPQDPDVHALLGIIMSASNREEEAMKYFRQALYLEPRHGESLLHMAVLQDRHGDGDRAKRYRRRAVNRGGRE